jgi:hypothetical protein
MLRLNADSQRKTGDVKYEPYSLFDARAMAAVVEP